MACKIRVNTTKYKLPLNHRWLNKSWYLNQTLYKAWRYHLYVHNLQVEDIVFRKIVYDAIYDSLVNEYDKVRHKDFLNEYAKFQQYWNENFSELNDRIIEWENYRQSGKYQYFLEQLKHIRRFDRRVQTAVDNALAFMYAKFQKGFVIAETLEQIEQRLKFDIIQKVWSKKWLWFATSILFFDANNLYANTLGRTKYNITEYDTETNEAIKVYVQRWYERKDLALSNYEKMLFKTYEQIIVPITGELGSVLLAEAARKGTCIALIHAARMLANFATFHPALRCLAWGTELLGSLAQILNNSVLAWLGWQIGVEWTFDGTIQAFMNEAIKYIYAGLTGKSVWHTREWVDWGLFDLACYYQYKKHVEGKISADEQELIDFIYQEGSDKQKQILDRIAKTIQTAQAMYAFKKFFHKTEEKFLDEAKDLINLAKYRPEFYAFYAEQALSKQFLESNIKQKIEMLQNAKQEGLEDHDYYSISVKDTEREYEDENGLKHQECGIERRSKIFVGLSNCEYIEDDYCCEFAYTEFMHYRSYLDCAEKEEYTNEEAKEFFESLFDRVKTALKWDYGIKSVIRQKDLFKLPLFFISDLLRPRITVSCVSVIHQGKRTFKYIIDYDDKYRNRVFFFRRLAYKYLFDYFYLSSWEAYAELRLSNHHIYHPPVIWEAEWEETKTYMNGAKTDTRIMYRTGWQPGAWRYVREVLTCFSEIECEELKFTFKDDRIIIERRRNKEWKPNYKAEYADLLGCLSRAPVDCYVITINWDSPSRTFKRPSKRSKLVCY